MSIIFAFILGFLLQAIALKWSLAILGQNSAQNKFGTALGVVAMLNVSVVAISFVPLVGWVLKPLVWLLIVMAVYRIGFFKSIGVAIFQVLIQIFIKWVLALIGLTWLLSIS